MLRVLGNIELKPCNAHVSHGCSSHASPLDSRKVLLIKSKIASLKVHLVRGIASSSCHGYVYGEHVLAPIIGITKRGGFLR